MNHTFFVRTPPAEAALAQRIVRGAPLIFSAQPYDVRVLLGFPRVEVCFPHADRGAARIRIAYLDGGPRLLDWEGDTWKAYAYEGVTWYLEELGTADLYVLYRVLTPQLHHIYSALTNGTTGDNIATLGYTAEAVRRAVSIRTPLLADFARNSMPHRAALPLPLATYPGLGDFSTRISYAYGEGLLIWKGDAWSNYALKKGEWVEREMGDTAFQALHQALAPQICSLFQPTPA